MHMTPQKLVFMRSRNQRKREQTSERSGAELKRLARLERLRIDALSSLRLEKVILRKTKTTVLPSTFYVTSRTDTKIFQHATPGICHMHVKLARSFSQLQLPHKVF